jgi:NADPH-dependent 2,4-dienoyl-CoA reductase/sulfur reductase-like enzyme
MAVPRGVNAHLGKALKKKVKTAKVMLGQRINNPELAERLLEEEAADIILLGRPLIADPYFPQKVLKGRNEAIRKCIACCHCVDNLGFGRSIRCVVNPVVGFERDYARLPRAEKPKKVLIIGGGPGGMEAARVAAVKGHKVILCEKSKRLGGQLKYGSIPPHKEELKNIIDYYERQLPELAVDVRLDTEMDVQKIKDINPEAVILATGAIPIRPKLSGIDAPNVLMAQEVLKDAEIIKGDKVAIVGGGSVGAEIGELLAVHGKNVTILEMKDAIAADMGLFLAVDFHDRLARLEVNQITNATVKRIEEEKIIYADATGEEKSLDVDCVVLAAGYVSNRNLAQDIEEFVEDVVLVGDCVSPRKIFNAIHEGFHAARMLE